MSAERIAAIPAVRERAKIERDAGYADLNALENYTLARQAFLAANDEAAPQAYLDMIDARAACIMARRAWERAAVATDDALLEGRP